HEVRHGAGRYRAQPQPRQIALPVGRERADSADLDGDGAQVGKPAQGERGDGERLRRQVVLQGSEVLERHHFIGDQARAQQAPDRPGVMPRYAQQPRNGSEDPAEDYLQRLGKPSHLPVYPAHHAVHQGDQGQKRDQHGADIEHQAETVAGALRGGIDHVHRGLLHVNFHLARGGRFFGFRYEDLGQHDGSRRGHDHRGKQVAGFHEADADVGRHYGARNVRHAAGHDGKQFGLGHAREKGLDGERSFRLAHEDAGRHVQRLRAADTHHFLHGDGHDFDHALHEAQVVQNREERGDEDDDGQHLEGEHETDRGIIGAQLPEYERAAGFGVAEHRGHTLADDAQNLTRRRLQYDDREGELQADAPQNQAELDIFLVRREQPRDSQDYGQAQETREPAHYPTTSKMSSRSPGFCEEMWKASSTISAASSTRSSLV